MEFLPTSGNLSSKYSPFYRLYTCVTEISLSACNMHPKCCGLGNLSRLRPVLLVWSDVTVDVDADISSDFAKEKETP